MFGKYQKAIELDPNYPYPYHNIAHYLFRQGRYKESWEAWEKACHVYAEQVRNVDYLYYYGSILEELGEVDKAESQYQKGLELDPQRSEILMGLGRLYLEKWEDVPIAASESTKTDPDRKAQLYRQAQAKFKHAETILKGKVKNPTPGDAYLQLGQLLLEWEEYEEAKEHLLKAPVKSATCYNYLGVVHTRLEDFRIAISYFEKAHKADPEDLTIWSNLAEAYLKSNLKEKAEVEFKKILSITPYHVESQIGLGEVYTERGEDAEMYTAAIDCFTNVLAGYEGAIAYFGRCDATRQWKSNWPRNSSKRLKKKEIAAVLYSRGYARVKLYELRKIVRDDEQLKEALQDFKDCSRLTRTTKSPGVLLKSLKGD